MLVVRRFSLALLSIVMMVLFAASAFAAGRVQWKSNKFSEREGGSWRIELAIYLPRAPDVAYVPMKFEFQPTVYYERSLVDGRDGPVENRVPLEGRQALIESVDVGFLDAGTAKIESRTKFTFKLTRALGYEAGEYKVTVRDARNGNTIGTVQNITLEGQNEIIDRRSIVFTGEKKKKKEEKKDDGGEKKDESADKPAEEKPAGDTPSEGGSDEGGADEGGSEDGEGEGEDADEYTIKDKPGACGCRVPGGGSPTNGLLISVLGLALLGLTRRSFRR
jgi:MYXO-CTERM domain-containing protein